MITLVVVSLIPSSTSLSQPARGVTVRWATSPGSPTTRRSCATRANSMGGDHLRADRGAGRVHAGPIGALILNRGIRLRRRRAVPVHPHHDGTDRRGPALEDHARGLLGIDLLQPARAFRPVHRGVDLRPPNAALYALILVDIWQWTPFMMLAFFAGLQALPVNPYRAAAVDGADWCRRSFRLTLPMLSPVLAVIGLLRLIDAFKVFDTIFLLTGGGPERRPIPEHPRLQARVRVLAGRRGLGARGPVGFVLRLLQHLLPRRPQAAERVLEKPGHEDRSIDPGDRSLDAARPRLRCPDPVPGAGSRP